MAKRKEPPKDPYERMARKVWEANGRPSREKQMKEIEKFFDELRKAYDTPGYLEKVVAKMEADTEAIRRQATVNPDKLNIRITYQRQDRR